MPELNTVITPSDLTDDETRALDEWADREDVVLYGWVSLELLNEGEVEVERVDSFGCSYYGPDIDTYQTASPPPIPQDRVL